MDIEAIKREIQKTLLRVPNRLHIARKARGFTSYTSFAMACDTNLTTYMNHENGKNEIGISQAMLYSKVLNISLNWLLTGTGTPLEHIDNSELDSTDTKLFNAHLDFLRAKKPSEKV
jgi:transcriptional regulator with XRE-family HTH domain